VLRDHFDRTSAHLTPEEIAEMTALPLDAVQNALRVLYKARRETFGCRLCVRPPGRHPRASYMHPRSLCICVIRSGLCGAARVRR